MATFAQLEDVLALFETPPNDTRQAARLEPLLQTVTDELIGELGGFDYLRHPETGSESWLVDGSGDGMLHLHGGVIELDTVEISFDRGETFTELDADNWRLQSGPFGDEAGVTGEPYFHLRLLPWGSYRTFPRGRGTVRLTGARGWASPPTPLVEGTAERVRQLAYGDAMYSGSVVGADDEGFGTSFATTTRWPDVIYRFMRRESRRFMSCEQ